MQVKTEMPDYRCCSCSASLQIHYLGTSRVKQLGLLKAAVPELPPAWLWAALRAVSRGGGRLWAMGSSCLPSQCYTESPVPACKVSLTAEHPPREGKHQGHQGVWHKQDKGNLNGFLCISSGQLTSAVPASSAGQRHFKAPLHFCGREGKKLKAFNLATVSGEM